MNKETLRKKLLAARIAMSQASYQQHNKRLCTRLHKHISTYSPQAIHSFLPIYARKEPDVFPLFQVFWQENLPLYTSITQKGFSQLQHARLRSDTALQPGPWGIPTPVSVPIVPLSELQAMNRLLMIVPLLAFDTQGHRLGYGKGYYDRLLAQLPHCYVIGVSFFPPLHTVSPSPSDVPLQACITPTKAHIFKASS